MDICSLVSAPGSDSMPRSRTLKLGGCLLISVVNLDCPVEWPSVTTDSLDIYKLCAHFLDFVVKVKITNIIYLVKYCT